VLSWEVEMSQHLAILEQFVSRLRIFGSVGLPRNGPPGPGQPPLFSAFMMLWSAALTFGRRPDGTASRILAICAFYADVGIRCNTPTSGLAPTSGWP